MRKAVKTCIDRSEIISVAVIVSNLELNGISSVIMNYCSNMDLNRFKVVIFAGQNIAIEHKERCHKLGIKIYELPHRKRFPLSYYKKLSRYLGENHYDIAHIHGNSAIMAIELFIAKKSGIKIRIAHSHNTTCAHIIIHSFLKTWFNRLYTHGFACGKGAGQWLFGKKKFIVVPNGLTVENFKFDKDLRFETRKELGIQNQFVLGHVGRMNEQKNQAYLLKIFEYVAEKEKLATLLLVGTGPMMEQIRNQIENHPYKDRIILFGETSAPEKMYLAMDVFVFPSKYEGTPLTLLEAQISGLPCIASDVITQEAVLSDSLKMLSIKEDPAVWAKEICQVKSFDRAQFYSAHLNEINTYNIKKTVHFLEGLYEQCIEETCS